MDSVFPILFSGIQSITIIIYFDAKIVPSLVIRSPFKQFPCLSSHHSCNTLLLVASQLKPDSSYPLPLPALEPIISPRSPSSLQWRMALRNQDLGAKCAYYHWGIPYAKNFGIYVCMTHMYICTSKSNNLSTHIHIYIESHEFMCRPPIPVHHLRVCSSFLAFHNCNSLWKK